ncbi:MAG: hypothetical protein GW848_08570 [Rhodoferax sp.]|nr:hypothetical protein [Rhodoferax sp.]PIW09638.1 MAG: hypothetical protein COW39_03845 [Comamonadaceae bacterium CG17_big_fil_post_rev_8_21_14_2_50_60_13]PIY24716.1 MAG: hypothetical protein COZ10_06450 [Comamonadaceae bacterium CG_4_10_14_3_um_filter_60_75]PJC11469.1 MAG: hypothetical protein CO066_15400 [Comamonadaceae bacterium CG_4_9_14_0_8_um_filter_60_18]
MIVISNTTPFISLCSVDLLHLLPSIFGEVLVAPSAVEVKQVVRTLVPGLTGWAQVNGRDELLIPEKVKLDLAYLQRQSLWFGIRILWLTFVKVLKRDGVSH